MNKTLIDAGERVQGYQNIVSGKGFFRYFGDEYRSKKLAKQIACDDGTTLSVQASKTHYCRPRDDSGPYSHVEVGYPSADPPQPTWARYADGEWPSSVYGYVPIELVMEYIETHGGESATSTRR